MTASSTPTEWEAVRAAAREQVEANIATQDARVSVVGQTTHGEPFLIAPLDGNDSSRARSNTPRWRWPPV